MLFWVQKMDKYFSLLWFFYKPDAISMENLLILISEPIEINKYDFKLILYTGIYENCRLHCRTFDPINCV